MELMYQVSELALSYRHDNKILLLKEEQGDTSHLNQAYDSYI